MNATFARSRTRPGLRLAPAAAGVAESIADEPSATADGSGLDSPQSTSGVGSAPGWLDMSGDMDAIGDGEEAGRREVTGELSGSSEMLAAGKPLERGEEQGSMDGPPGRGDCAVAAMVAVASSAAAISSAAMGPGAE